MGFMDKFEEIEEKNSESKNLSGMFRKPTEAKPVSTSATPKKEVKEEKEENVKYIVVGGRPCYEFARGRKLRAVTTKLCEDNIEWLCEYAMQFGKTSGQISYSLNRLIEEKRFGKEWFNKD